MRFAARRRLSGRARARAAARHATFRAGGCSPAAAPSPCSRRARGTRSCSSAARCGQSAEPTSRSSRSVRAVSARSSVTFSSSDWRTSSQRSTASRSRRGSRPRAAAASAGGAVGGEHRAVGALGQAEQVAEGQRRELEAEVEHLGARAAAVALGGLLELALERLALAALRLGLEPLARTRAPPSPRPPRGAPRRARAARATARPRSPRAPRPPARRARARPRRRAAPRPPRTRGSAPAPRCRAPAARTRPRAAGSTPSASSPAAIRSADSGSKRTSWQRETTVSSTCPSASVSRIRCTKSAGSSSVFSSRLATSSFIVSARSSTNTRRDDSNGVRVGACYDRLVHVAHAHHVRAGRLDPGQVGMGARAARACAPPRGRPRRPPAARRPARARRCACRSRRAVEEIGVRGVVAGERGAQHHPRVRVVLGPREHRRRAHRPRPPPARSRRPPSRRPAPRPRAGRRPPAASARARRRPSARTRARTRSWSATPSLSKRSASAPRAAAAPVSSDEQEGQVGRQAAGGPRVQARYLVDPEPAGLALVGERRVEEAVRHHHAPVLERRAG